MTTSADRLVDELVDYFEHGPQSSTAHFLDLPRAAVVEGIPAHRPSHDFVALPDRPLTKRRLMREFLDSNGQPTPDSVADERLEELVSGDAEAFEAYRARAARKRVRKWLDEQGVIYTG